MFRSSIFFWRTSRFSQWILARPAMSQEAPSRESVIVHTNLLGVWFGSWLLTQLSALVRGSCSTSVWSQVDNTDLTAVPLFMQVSLMGSSQLKHNVPGSGWIPGKHYFCTVMSIYVWQSFENRPTVFLKLSMSVRTFENRNHTAWTTVMKLSVKVHL